MHFIVNGICLSYETFGTNIDSPLVILPGWGNTKDTWKNMIMYLSKYHKVYLIEYPGFGNTKFPNRDLTIYDYTLLIKEFLEQEELNNPILLGHSFGGRIIILLLGYYHYKTDKIILMDSAGLLPKKTFKNKCNHMKYIILKKLGTIIPKKKQKNYQEWLVNTFGSSDYKALHPSIRKTFSNIVKEDLFPYLKEIKASSLLIYGENDTITPLSDGTKMEKEITNSGLVIVPNASHFPYLDQPNYVLLIIKTFLND